jgi:HK97 family phage major capsid protein
MSKMNRTRGIIAARADAGAMAVVAELQTAFAAFKAAHEESLKGKADVVLAEKVERISAAVNEKQAEIDMLNVKLAALSDHAKTGGRVVDAEYTAAFSAHIRKGEVQASVNKGADAEGGFLAPVEWDRTITDKLKLISPMRQIARVQAIGTNGFSKLFNNREMASGWVGEAAARPETGTSTFGSLAFPTGELYANPAATQGMLDDALVDLEAWIASEVQTEFAKQEGLAFVNGNGTARPHGFLGYVTGGAFAARHPFGAITLTNTGLAAAISADSIINLIHALPQAFTQGAVFVMNRSTMNAVRLLKDGQGNYLWQPSYAAGQPPTLAGYPVIEMPDMPNVGAGAFPIAFGNFNEGYLVVDRTGTRVLRDPYTNKPFVMFYTTKRVGGGVLNPEALKVLRVQV